jgi:2C-methyl-D-erythritol 2,4-cyclodiphosphate synthase
MECVEHRDFLSHVGDIMEDETFRTFFKKYFDDWDDVVSAVMLMKTYYILSEKNKGLRKDVKVEALREYMRDSDFRHNLANSMCEFMNVKKNNVRSIARINVNNINERDCQNTHSDVGRGVLFRIES